MTQLRIFLDGKLIGALWLRGRIEIDEHGVIARTGYLDTAQLCAIAGVRYEVISA